MSHYRWSKEAKALTGNPWVPADVKLLDYLPSVKHGYYDHQLGAYITDKQQIRDICRAKGLKWTSSADENRTNPWRGLSESRPLHKKVFVQL